MSRLIKKKLFRPYIRRLSEARLALASVQNSSVIQMALARADNLNHPKPPNALFRRYFQDLRQLFMAYRGVLAGHYVLSVWN
jgi:hypothetical protein